MQLFGADTQENTLKELGVNSEKTQELTRAFTELLIKRNKSDTPIHVSFFYETLSTNIRGVGNTHVVEPDSAQVNGCGDAIPVRADHHNICKFATEKEEGYGLIVASIKKTLALLEGRPQDDEGRGTWIYNYGKAVNVGSVTINGGQRNSIS
ncbi:hypothetical protein ONZ43_g5183 [Nemania bipapillata]|uniref:Uncharacterized protein n=1 Tax=Nemania bipapillata TaxID=110536 RepID=A0ACC2IDQ0_9PEZI|nr:hypothetical protein ONZ43_g5183 [Nemania bipapillata]